jgi:hypothetical protein
MTSSHLILSAPALAAAIRTMDRTHFMATPAEFTRAERLPPMYHILAGDVADEASAAAHVVSNVAERMRRLASAYGEWDHFDAAAYFDLSRPHAETMVRVVERVSTVHVVFYVDLLLPSLRNTVDFWAEQFAPAFAQIRVEPEVARHVHDCLQPALVERWQRLCAVIRLARTLLAEDIGFLATNAAAEERSHWQHWWMLPPLHGLVPALTPPLTETPTLTLSLDFALPAHRQPGRLRRLRAARDRRLRLRTKQRILL